MTFSIPDKSKVNAKRYIELLPRQIEECKSLLPSGFISHQDHAPAHRAQLAQDWIATNCSEFIGKSEWPPRRTLALLSITSGQLCQNTTRLLSQVKEKTLID